MAIKPDFIVRHGEPLCLSLLAIDGDIATVDSVTAVLKSAGPNGSIPPTTSPILATFEISDAEAPDVGWDLALSSEIVSSLSPGYYVTNAQLNLTSGGPIKSDHVIIQVRRTVT
jgi:hypothetical protein